MGLLGGLTFDNCYQRKLSLLDISITDSDGEIKEGDFDSVTNLKHCRNEEEVGLGEKGVRRTRM